MTKKRKSVITDTGYVERLIDDKGGHAYVINWPEGVERPPGKGRPTEKDWQGVLLWLLAKVGKEGEGLPQGRGAKAEVIGWIMQWFIDRDLDASESLIKRQVDRIYKIAVAGPLDLEGNK